jgi:O-antigen ligase
VSLILGFLGGFFPFWFFLSSCFVVLEIILFCYFFEAFLVLVFLIPFLPALNISTSIDLASVRLAVIIFTINWIIISLIKRSLQIPIDKISLLLLLFFIWISFSYFYTPIAERTFRKWLVLFNFLPLFFMSYSVFYKNKKRIITFAKAINYSCVLVVLIGLCQFGAQFIIGKESIIKFYVNNAGVFLWGKNVADTIKENPSWLFDAGFVDILRSFSTLPDPHMLSFFLAFGVPLQAGLYIKEKEIKKKNGYLLVLIFSLITVLLTFARGGYLGIFAGGSFFYFLFFIKNKKSRQIEKKEIERKKVKMVKKVISSFFIISTCMIILFSNNIISQRAYSIFNFEEGSNQGRFKIWQQAGDLFARQPLLGVGLGAYSYTIKPSATYRDPIYAHNLYLELLAETGIIGGILWITCVFFAIQTLTKRFLEEEERVKNTYIYLGLASSLIGFSTHSFFEMPIYSPVILPLFFSFMGIASVSCSGK